MSPPSNSYANQSAVFLNQAHQELKNGDLRQASEKGWGAAAQMIKAVAEEHSWAHNHHSHLHRAVSRLGKELDDDDLLLQFASAGQLHGNFYEGWLDSNTITLYLAQVKLFTDKLEKQLG